MDPKQVNVLGLPKRPGFVETTIEHLARNAAVPTISDIDNEIDPKASNVSTRHKRNSGVVILPEAITDNEGKTKHVVTMVISKGKSSQFRFQLTHFCLFLGL